MTGRSQTPEVDMEDMEEATGVVTVVDMEEDTEEDTEVAMGIMEKSQ